MCKLLIADDEALEREGLEMIIERLMPDTFQFFHAQNGRVAIELAEEIRPDIVMMDINMPGIQGLEALKEIRGKNPDIKMVLISAYDYFSYAQEAISLGVKDYLLKPAKREQIMELLKKLLAEIEREKKQRKDELELKEKVSHLLPLVENELSIMLMLEHVQEVDLRRLTKMLELDVQAGFTMVISFSQKEETDFKRFNEEKRNIFHAVKNLIKANRPCIVSPIIGSQMALFLPLPDTANSYSHRGESITLGRKICQQIKNQFRLTVYIGIGSVQQGVEGFRQSYHEALMVATDHFSPAHVRHFKDLHMESGLRSFTIEEERQLLQVMQNSDEATVIQTFREMFGRLIHHTGQDMEICRNRISELFIVLSRRLFEWGISAEGVTHFGSIAHLEQLGETAEYRLRHIHQMVVEKRETRTRSQLDQAREYIKENFRSDITMEEVAEQVNLSSYYFSKMFKQQMGETFIDYITKIRIDEAKSLLVNSDLSLKEICYQVGYNDPNYFSRVFKKVVGKSPSEYRTGLAAVN